MVVHLFGGDERLPRFGDASRRDSKSLPRTDSLSSRTDSRLPEMPELEPPPLLPRRRLREKEPEAPFAIRRAPALSAASDVAAADTSSPLLRTICSSAASAVHMHAGWAPTLLLLLVRSRLAVGRSHVLRLRCRHLPDQNLEMRYKLATTTTTYSLYSRGLACSIESHLFPPARCSLARAHSLTLPLTTSPSEQRLETKAGHASRSA